MAENRTGDGMNAGGGVNLASVFNISGDTTIKLNAFQLSGSTKTVTKVNLQIYKIQ